MRRLTPFALLALVLPAGILAASACGGRIFALPPDGGEDGAGDAPLPDATESSAPDAGSDVAPPCDYDATDEVLCTPPDDDLLYADPASVQVAAGSYGVATFKASGPWASDPSFFMWFDGTSLPVENFPQVLTYGTPQSIPFLVATAAAGSQGTFTVKGHAGNIERTASVNVTVTQCQPWPASTVCPGQVCGFQGDGCGGLLSCGQCEAPTPNCWVGQCIGTKPTPCSAGDGFDPDAGKCIPCSESAACNPCPKPSEANQVWGTCISEESMCICYTTPKPSRPNTDPLADAGAD